MSILMEDAVESLGEEDRAQHNRGELASVLYADDTLLVGISSESLQRFLTAVADAGAGYGLELHQDKFQLLQVRTDAAVRTQDGILIRSKASMSYLGISLHADGAMKCELGQKLGMAWADFASLSRLWSHTSVSKVRKIEVFQSVISARLLYGLNSAWLNIADARRLDGFQARCLRRILGIRHAYYSRVSNKTVLELAQQPPYTKQLLKQQLLLYGKIARSADNDPLRAVTFCRGSLRPATSQYMRKVGRPRNEWAVKLYEKALAATGGIAQLDELIKSTASWKAVLHRYLHI